MPHSKASRQQSANDLAYAIDFGTSNSLIAVSGGSHALQALPINTGAADPTVLRSILYSPEGGHWYYGDEAIERYGDLSHEGRIFRSLKKFLPDANFKGTNLHGKNYRLVDLIALFLRTLRERANEQLGIDVDHLVLGKPARYAVNADEEALACERMLEAARLAGFKGDVSFCPEPVAAAYNFKTELLQGKQTVLIADFGGGTSDFTILRMDASGFDDKDILALHGVSIAGDAFDGSLMQHHISHQFGSGVSYRLPLGSNDLSLPHYLVRKMCSAADISFLARKDIMRILEDANRWSLNQNDSQKMHNLFTLVQEHLGYELFSEIEGCKKALSSQESALFKFRSCGIEIEEVISATKFRDESQGLVDKILTCLSETMNQAGLKYEDIDIVCSTGGTAQLPALRHGLEGRFGAEKLKQFKYFHSVISGLATHAAQLRS